jgi:hypothetical protein
VREAAWSLAILALLGALALVQALGAEALVLFGRDMMVRAAALGLPLELVYFAALGHVLRRSGGAPRGWYWRSFEHHHRLMPGARRWVLPWFYLGTLAMLAIVLGVVLVVLALVGVALRGGITP